MNQLILLVILMTCLAFAILVRNAAHKRQFTYSMESQLYVFFCVRGQRLQNQCIQILDMLRIQVGATNQFESGIGCLITFPERTQIPQLIKYFSCRESAGLPIVLCYADIKDGQCLVHVDTFVIGAGAPESYFTTLGSIGELNAITLQQELVSHATEQTKQIPSFSPSSVRIGIGRSPVLDKDIAPSILAAIA